jgi:hypothetical protein
MRCSVSSIVSQATELSIPAKTVRLSVRQREPGEGAFDDPALGQDDELSSIAAFDDLHRPGQHGHHPIDQLAGIAAIGKDLPDAGTESGRRGPLPDPGYRPNGPRPSKFPASQNEAQRIDGNVLFSPLGFLARVVTGRGTAADASFVHPTLANRGHLIAVLTRCAKLKEAPVSASREQ